MKMYRLYSQDSNELVYETNDKQDAIDKLQNSIYTVSGIPAGFSLYAKIMDVIPNCNEEELKKALSDA